MSFTHLKTFDGSVIKKITFFINYNPEYNTGRIIETHFHFNNNIELVDIENDFGKNKIQLKLIDLDIGYMDNNFPLNELVLEISDAVFIFILVIGKIGLINSP